MTRFRAHLAGLVVMIFITTAARAVVVGVTTTTTDPGTAAWNYVGSIDGASGVFLGNYGGSGWVLTAGHVGAHDFTLGATTYSVGGSSFTNFIYNSQVADLTLFQIVGTPALANLSPATPPTHYPVELIGFGGGKSWGNNTVFGFGDYTIDGTSFGGPGIITLASGGGQGVGGDSGGGLFAESSGTWFLTGILSGVGHVSDGLTDFGNGTFSVDLSFYTGQIAADINSVSAIPEPSTSALLLGFAAALGVVIVRRRKLP